LVGLLKTGSELVYSTLEVSSGGRCASAGLLRGFTGQWCTALYLGAGTEVGEWGGRIKA